MTRKDDKRETGFSAQGAAVLGANPRHRYVRYASQPSTAALWWLVGGTQLTLCLGNTTSTETIITVRSNE